MLFFQAIKQHIAQGPMMLDVLMHKPNTVAKTFIDSLSAFWPGIQVSSNYSYLIIGNIFCCCITKFINSVLNSQNFDLTLNPFVSRLTFIKC